MQETFHNLRHQKKKLREAVKKTFGPDDQKKVFTAFDFAQIKHKGQKRDEGTQYIIHPTRVARFLLEVVGTWDADMIVSALLHDVVEDCGVKVKQIEKKFGKRVGKFVYALTRVKCKNETQKEKEQCKISKLLALVHEPMEVKLIKCSDILDNIRSASDVSFYSPGSKKFPRWDREFKESVNFAKGLHTEIYKEMQKALRVFEMKRVARGVVRIGKKS